MEMSRVFAKTVIKKIAMDAGIYLISSRWTVKIIVYDQAVGSWDQDLKRIYITFHRLVYLCRPTYSGKIILNHIL